MKVLFSTCLNKETWSIALIAKKLEKFNKNIKNNFKNYACFMKKGYPRLETSMKESCNNLAAATNYLINHPLEYRQRNSRFLSKKLL